MDRTRNVDLISTTEAARRKLEDILIRETSGELDQITSEIVAMSFDECVRMEHIDFTEKNKNLIERVDTRDSQVIQLLAKDHINKLGWMRALLFAAKYWWLLGFGFLFAVASAINGNVDLRGIAIVPILIQLGLYVVDKAVDDKGLRFRIYDRAIDYVKQKYIDRITAKIDAAGYGADKEAVIDYCLTHTKALNKSK